MKVKRCLIMASVMLLLAAMLLSVVACGTNEENPSSTSTEPLESQVPETEAETQYDPGIEVTNYNCDFNVVIGGTFDPKYLFVEEGLGDTMSDSVYERQVKIKDHLGVEFTHQDGGGWTAYSSTINRVVLSGGDDYQLVMTHVYQGVTDLITNNSLYDMAELPSVNLSAPWWHSDLMEEIKINDQYLLGYNDLSAATPEMPPGVPRTPLVSPAGAGCRSLTLSPPVI